MKKSILFVIVFLLITISASGCVPVLTAMPTSIPSTHTPSPLPPTASLALTATTAAITSSWEVYTNEEWGFSLEHPTAWAVSSYDTGFGFFGRQVVWGAVNYDPMQQPGDAPSVDEMTQITIDGQPAARVTGYYQGAIGDMGYQQYLRYVIHKGNVYYVFTLCAIDALGIPQEMMTEKHPLRQSDVELFEQMIATLKFSN